MSDIHPGDKVSHINSHRKPTGYSKLSNKQNLSYWGIVLQQDGDRSLVHWGNGVTAWIDSVKLAVATDQKPPMLP